LPPAFTFVYMEVKAAELARMVGVTRQSIYSKIKNHTLAVNAAGLLDTDNALNAQYLANQRRRKARLAPAQATAPPGGNAGPDVTQPGSIASPAPPIIRNDIEAAADAGIPQELLALSLRELVIQYNGLYNLERHAKILRDLTMSNEKDQRIRERGLKLIEKDFVTSRLFQFLDVLMRQLLEFPDSAVDDLIAKVQSHGLDARADITQALKDGLGRVIAGAKEEIIRELDSLKGKYQAGERPAEIRPKTAETAVLDAADAPGGGGSD
jgi:hypothetical protein